MEKAGPDYILNECLKNSIDIMLHYLHALLTRLLALIIFWIFGGWFHCSVVQEMKY